VPSIVNGVRIAYQELGEGHPIVLLHGFMGLGSQWISPGPAAALASAGFRVILPDLRGHGASGCSFAAPVRGGRSSLVRGCR
jgi:pimeloyl-ACP methyl ester carboxylesterase